MEFYKINLTSKLPTLSNILEKFRSLGTKRLYKSSQPYKISKRNTAKLQPRNIRPKSTILTPHTMTSKTYMIKN
jgi:hypothetical protein